MSGICVEKLSHSCGSSNALQVFEQEDGSVSGFCFSCGEYVENPYKGTNKTPQKSIKKTKEEIQVEIDETQECKSLDLLKRRIRGKDLEHFGVKVGFDPTTGKIPTFVYFPYYTGEELTRVKTRLINKKVFWNYSNSKDVDLFGWKLAKSSASNRLIITEGEYDAIAMHKILHLYTPEKYSDFIPAVVSLTNGASGALKDVTRLLPQIKRKFKEVILCFDNDEAGRSAEKQVLGILPSALSITLPEKDANDCLMAGLGKEVYKIATFSKEKPKNTRLVLGGSLKDDAKHRPSMGLSWPFKGLTELTRGIRRGETYYFGSGVKMGKSELVDTICEHLIVEHNLPVLICKPEQDKARTYQMLVGKAAGRIFHDPNIEFDYEAFDKSEPSIDDKAIIVDSYQFVDWESLKEDIIYAVNVYDCHDVMIDPITCFTSGMKATDTNEFLIKMAAELSAMAKDLNFTAYLFCHLKSPTKEPPHERGGEVLSTQFTGSRAMMRSCHMMLGLEGNKDPNLDKYERNTRYLKILEDRNFGASGQVKLYWDCETGLFNEIGVKI